MDITLRLVQVTEKMLLRYKEAINKSDLPLFTKQELIDILETAVEHTKDARAMGWLSDTDDIYAPRS